MSTTPPEPIADLLNRPRDLEADPVRLILIVRRVEDGNYLFARWPDWPHPAMLAFDPPSPDEGLDAAVASLLTARMRVHPAGPARAAAERRPVRMRQPYTGSDRTGWLLPVAVDVTGDPEPDALLEEVITLTTEEAERDLPSSIERAVFRMALPLLD